MPEDSAAGVLRRFAPENAFHDLSIRSSIFRTRLIEEFQLLDNLSDNNLASAPVHSTKDIQDPEQLKRILSENPHQLIKFHAFKRVQQLENAQKTDRRLTRTRNIETVPLGAWANWVVEHPVFQNLLLFLIIANSVLVGVQAELHESEADHHQLFQAMKVIDQFVLSMFIIEIWLKWTDDFWMFWKDGWNIMDFSITMLSAIPEIMEVVGSASASNALLSVTRELRTIRVLRALKVIVRFGSLKIIVLTIMQAFESMAFIMLLVLIFMYIFAIIAINLFEAYVRSNVPDLHYQYAWQSLGTALQMLFQLLTLDQWDDINMDMDRATEPMLTTVFIFLWVCLGSFIFRNVFVGVMVNNFAKISETLKEKKAEYFKKRKFLRMRKKLNKELKVQGNIQRSINNLAADGTGVSPQNSPSDMKGPAPSEAGATVGASEPDAAFGNEGGAVVDHNMPVSNQEDQMLRGGLESNPIPGTEPVPDMGSTTAGRDDGTKDVKTDERNDTDILETIQRLLIASHGISKEWEQTVAETLAGLTAHSEETMWPKDTLFKYFQLMETLQENMKEYQELQMLAAWSLMELHDT